MARINSPNNAESTLAGAITASSTSFSVAAGHGVRFGTAPFVITIDSEAMLVGVRTTDAFSSVTRAYEPVAGVQTAASHSEGATVKANPTGKQLGNIYDQLGMVRIASNMTEVQITSTTNGDIMSFTGLNILGTTAILITGLCRKDVTGTNALQLGLGLNATNYDATGGSLANTCLWSSSTTARIEMGTFSLLLDSRRANYGRVSRSKIFLIDSTGAFVDDTYRRPFHAADVITDVLTQIRIRGRITPATGTGAWLRDVKIYADLI